MSFPNPGNQTARLLADIESGSTHGDTHLSEQLNGLPLNELLIRRATLDDSTMLEKIEREAFPGMTPVTQISRDLTRENGIYLVAARQWHPDELELGARFAIATRAEKEADGLVARLKRSVDKYLLDRIHTPTLPADYIAGFIGLWLVLDEAHVVIIGLREIDRRKGIGELLLINGLEHALENGSRVVTLEVRRSNRPAIELYRKYGFQEVGLRRRYYSDNGEDALIMTTPPIHSDDYLEHFNTLRDLHAAKWGEVKRPA
ncbi:MAG: ribosomal protein S18-alanine N-acetyltransferase [Chloroflexi bacterium]|nr:ribosomal protein S18-alanine N-acetyltransferase [Chloroflexota bacterium]